jgi:hypothetical protein
VFRDGDLHLRARERRQRFGHRDVVVPFWDERDARRATADTELRLPPANEATDPCEPLSTTGIAMAESTHGTHDGFVERHRCAGGVIDDRENLDDPSITAINRTPWAVRKDEGARIINDAKISRSMAIESKIKTKLRLAREQSGFRAA